MKKSNFLPKEEDSDQSFFFFVLFSIFVHSLLSIYLILRQLHTLKKSRSFPLPRAYLKFMIEDEPKILYEYNLKKIHQELFEATICSLLIPTLELYYGLIPHLWTWSGLFAHITCFPGQETIITPLIFVFLFDFLSKIKHLPFAYYEAATIGREYLKIENTWEWVFKNSYYRFPAGLKVFRHIVWFAVDYLHPGECNLILIWVVETTLLSIFQELFEVYLRGGVVLDFPPNALSDECKAKLDLGVLKVFDSFAGARNYETIRFRKMVVLPPSLFCLGLQTTELSAFLKNELAHIKFHSQFKKKVIERVVSIILFYCLHICGNQDQLFSGLGLCSCSSNVVRWIIVEAYIFPVALKFINYFRNYHYRKDELKMDRFTKRILGRSNEALEEALLKIDIASLRFPFEDEYYMQFNMRTPSALYRIQEIGKIKCCIKD